VKAYLKPYGFRGALQAYPANGAAHVQRSVLELQSDYRITRNDADYFSVAFSVGGYREGAAHPFIHFTAFTLDKKSGKIVTLADLYQLNTDFAALLRQKAMEQLEPEAGHLLPLDDKELLEDLRESGERYAAFLTDSALGIAIPMSHAFGDYFEVMLDYKDLKAFQMK